MSRSVGKNYTCVIYGHPVIAATRALRFSGDKKKRKLWRRELSSHSIRSPWAPDSMSFKWPDQTNCNKIFSHYHAFEGGLLGKIVKIPQKSVQWGMPKFCLFKF